jgi:hypothetical protein
MSAREYIEALAIELSRLGGRGLVLSPADAQLALAWHASEVPLQAVVQELRRVGRPLRAAVRGVAAPGVSLQVIEKSIDARLRRRPRKPVRRRAEGLEAQLLSAARAPGLAARAAWEAQAGAAEELLALEGGERYWTAAVRALKVALRELPRQSALQAGAALRARLAPRPRGMPRRAYRRSLQLMLLSAASERIGLPPRAFLL